MSPVTRAVVPVAGLGTRLFPASHAVKKELFPVVGRDGIARALFHYHLLELEAAGIGEVCLVVQPGEDALVRSYLAGPGDDYLRRLARYPDLQQEAERMREAARRVRFAVQHVQEGYGHAVLQARAFAGDAPVLLCLGDHLFRGRTGSPYAELAALADTAGGRAVSAVNRITAGQLKGYGTIAGTRRADDPRLVEVSRIVEKPTPEEARAHLHVDGLPPETWLGWFGMHLLTPLTFEILDEMVRDDLRDHGEIQLTRAQELQRRREGYLALEMTGADRFDFGTPDDFVRSLAAFREP